MRVDTKGPATSVRVASGYRGRTLTVRYRVSDRLSALNEPGGPGLTGGAGLGSEPETKTLPACLRRGFSVVVSLHSRAGILGSGMRAALLAAAR